MSVHSIPAAPEEKKVNRPNSYKDRPDLNFCKEEKMRIRFVPAVWLIILFILIIGIGGCQTAYYHTMEKFGVHKRDILVDRGRGRARFPG